MSKQRLTLYRFVCDLCGDPIAESTSERDAETLLAASSAVVTHPGWAIKCWRCSRVALAAPEEQDLEYRVIYPSGVDAWPPPGPVEDAIASLRFEQRTVGPWKPLDQPEGGE
jgi:hypothetical protein